MNMNELNNVTENDYNVEVVVTILDDGCIVYVENDDITIAL